jgi:antitoxin component HigA of HigAB toxin-antitoxin module
VKPIEVIGALIEQFGLPAKAAEAKICRTAMLSNGKRLVELV